MEGCFHSPSPLPGLPGMRVPRSHGLRRGLQSNVRFADSAPRLSATLCTDSGPVSGPADASSHPISCYHRTDLRSRDVSFKQEYAVHGPLRNSVGCVLLYVWIALSGCANTGPDPAEPAATSQTRKNLYWGDLHNHNSIGQIRGSLERTFEIAQNHLDFFAFTPQSQWPDMRPIPGAATRSSYAASTRSRRTGSESSNSGMR